MAETTAWLHGRPAGPLSRLGLATVIAVVAVDQIAKAIAEARLPAGAAIDVLPILTLYRVHNTGVAFSFLAGSGSLAMILLMLAISAIVVVFWLQTRDGGRLTALGYALILGGAFGNLIDRFRLGEVIDFLLLHLGGWELFIFNFADAALTLGVILLLAANLLPAARTEEGGG